MVQLYIAALILFFVIVVMPERQEKRDIALQELQYLVDAVQRWEMDNNKRYPFDNLIQLEGRYIRSKEQMNDPWGNPYKVDRARGLVYSKGPNGVYDIGGEMGPVNKAVNWFGI